MLCAWLNRGFESSLVSTRLGTWEKGADTQIAQGRNLFSPFQDKQVAPSQRHLLRCHNIDFGSYMNSPSF